MIKCTSNRRTFIVLIMKFSLPFDICMGMALIAIPSSMMAQDCHQAIRLAANKIHVSKLNVARQDEFMTVAMSLNLDSLELPTNSQLIYTPVLKTTHGTAKLPEIVINGRRQQIMYQRGVGKRNFSDKALVVRRNNHHRQDVSYQATIPVEKGLKNFDLNLHEDLCGCGDLQDGRDFTLNRHRQPMAVFVKPQAEGVKIRHLDKRAYIDFPVDRTELHADYRRNPAQLDSIITTINALKNDKNLSVSAINIHGYASPESPYTHNDYLAKNRAKTLTDYVRRMVKLPNEIFSVSSTPEDWEGLRNYIKESNLEHKQEILAIACDESLNPDAREWRIKMTYPEEYRFMLDTWYPALRHSDYHITYKVKPFNVEEAKEIIKTQPQLLSLNEMFMLAQSYEAGSKEFNEVMETAVRMYPQNEIANLNAANTRLNAGDADGAKAYLDRAGNSSEAQNAKGVYEVLKGNLQAAKLYFEQAAKGGVKQAQENLDNL